MSDPKRYRTQIPNIIDDLGLDPYERALYVHYKRVCGDGNGGECFEAIRTTADKTKISLSKCWRTRTSLEERGLITVDGVKKGQKGTAIVKVVDIWPLNLAYYDHKDRLDITGWTIKQLTDWITNVSDKNIECSHNEHFTNESSQEEQSQDECFSQEQNVSDKNIECFSQTDKERTVVKKEPIRKNQKETKDSLPNGNSGKPPQKNKSSPLSPETESELLLFQKINRNREAKHLRPAQRFQTLEQKEKCNSEFSRLGKSEFEKCLDYWMAKGIIAGGDLVIRLEQWSQTNGNHKKASNSYAATNQPNRKNGASLQEQPVLDPRTGEIIEFGDPRHPSSRPH